MLEKYDARFEALKSRLQQNPDSLMFARVAEGLLRQGNVDEAIGICEEGIRKHPYYVTGHMVLGKCYLQKKQFDQAEKEFKRVILFDPKYIAAHKLYGDLMREHGWDNTCEMSYRKILSIDPLDGGAREMLDTLEQAKPKEQEVVTPEQPLISSYSSPMKEVRQEESAFGEPEPTMKPGAESINLEEDLFAEMDAPEEPSPSIARTEDDAATDEKEIKTILEDIFEDDDEGDDQFGVIEGLNIKISHRATSSPKPASEPKRKPPAVSEQQFPAEPEQPSSVEPPAEEALENPNDIFGIFDEETIEFDAMKDLSSRKNKTSDPLDTGELDFLSEPSADADDAHNDMFSNLDDAPGEQPPVQAARDHFDLPQAESNPRPELKEKAADFAPPPEPAAPAPQHVPEPEEPAQSREEAPADTMSQNGQDEETDAISREKIVTPTLGEIYTAQGQYAKAISVFELLLKNDNSNTGFQEKIIYLKQKLKESANV